VFKALVVDQQDGAVKAALQELAEEALPRGDVLVRVAYSSLNYKDGLAITGVGKVVRSYPMVPGIDYAGTVVESQSPLFKPGDHVILTGWGAGERHWGGFAQLARARAEWLVPLPAGLSLRQAMAIGTAGFTAMLCVMALEAHGVAPGGREVAVTGAAGGVGSVAVALLARLGYNVVASTGRAETHAYLRELGAREIIDRSVLATPSGRPLEPERWDGAVDTVGGETLASLLRSTAYGGSVAACGLAGGTGLNATVLPFILRGVSLLGIDSVMCPPARRLEAWQRLARDLPAAVLEQVTQEVPLEAVPALSPSILKGRVRGRVVVDVNR
jgi:acrylyl-CoA reductase (NADPH)